MKECQCKVSTKKLKHQQLKWNLFMRCTVTGDETWIHHYYPQDQATNHAVETCQFSKYHKFKVQASAGKIMRKIFWDAKGILLTDYAT